MNKYIFITSSNIREIYSNLDVPASPIDDLKNFTFIMIATLISVIAYVFGGIVEISVGERSLSDLWGQFEIWHILSIVASLFIATSTLNSLKMLNSRKWIKSVVILIPVPLFMWMSDFWALGIGEKNLFSWTVIVAFVSIFYFFTSGRKGVENFLTEIIDSDIAVAVKIVRYCKRNNQQIIYVGGDSANYGQTLNLFRDASIKEGCSDMVFDISDISIETMSAVDKSEFIFENKGKVKTILHEIYNKSLMKIFLELDETLLEKEDTLSSGNKLEAYCIHFSSHGDNIKIPISTPNYLRNKCFSKYKNDLHSAVLIYDFFFTCSDYDNEISFCTRKEIIFFNEKIITKIPSKDKNDDSFYYAGILAGLWDITNSLKNNNEDINSQSIKALCSLNEKEIFWPIAAYTFLSSSFLSNLYKSMTVKSLSLSFNEITGIYNILFTIGEYSKAKSLLNTTLTSYDFSWEYKSLILRVEQRLISKNSNTDIANKDYYSLFMSEFNKLGGFKEFLFEQLDFINNLIWIGTRIKKDEDLFNKLALPIDSLLSGVEKTLSFSSIDSISPNKIWHFHNNSANFYERLLDFNPGNQDYLKNTITHYYKSINVHNADLKWLSGSLINYAEFVDKNKKYLITDKSVVLRNGYSCSDEDIIELVKLSYKYKSQIYDLDEIKYPRRFLIKFKLQKLLIQALQLLVDEGVLESVPENIEIVDCEDKYQECFKSEIAISLSTKVKSTPNSLKQNIEKKLQDTKEIEKVEVEVKEFGLIKFFMRCDADA